jgi:hypothetical protein
MIFVNYKYRYQIVKYTDSWTCTSDLADSIHPRGEISNHYMEVAIEYMRRTNSGGKYYYGIPDFQIPYGMAF